MYATVYLHSVDQNTFNEASELHGTFVSYLIVKRISASSNYTLIVFINGCDCIE
jgi:hypothetical protein